MNTIDKLQYTESRTGNLSSIHLCTTEHAPTAAPLLDILKLVQTTNNTDVTPTFNDDDSISNVNAIISNLSDFEIPFRQAIITDQYIAYCAAVCEYNNTFTAIFDSGCTSHMSPIHDYMFNYTEVNDKFVSLGDHSVKLPIAGHGSTKLLHEVLHVPRLSFGLISIGRLDSCGYTTIFRHGIVQVRNYNGKLIMSGSKRNNLYILDANLVPYFLGSDTIDLSIY